MQPSLILGTEVTTWSEPVAWPEVLGAVPLSGEHSLLGSQVILRCTFGKLGLAKSPWRQLLQVTCLFKAL